MNTKEIPVLLLTGYLGSGKTTLVNRILTNKRGVKFAVIVNDIGEVNIDADLIEKGGIVDQKDDSLVALQNGCICCTLKMDLVEQLCDIMRMKRFDYIVIEASGVCEPAPIAQTICSIPTMGPKYIKDGIARLDNIVTVVDALRMKDEFAMGNDLMQKNIDEEDIVNLIIQQIEFCNMILLNKATEVEPHELQRIKHIIRALQPKADILECNYGEVDLDQLINTHRFNFDEVATSAAWIDAIEHHHDDEEEEEEHHHHHEHEHEDDHEHDDLIITNTNTIIITTITTAARWRNMASAPLFTIAASLSIWSTSTASLPSIGPTRSFDAKASAGLRTSHKPATSSNKRANKWACAMPDNGMPPCPRKNSNRFWPPTKDCEKIGTRPMATACKSSCLLVSTSTARKSQPI